MIDGQLDLLDELQALSESQKPGRSSRCQEAQRAWGRDGRGEDRSWRLTC